MLSIIDCSHHNKNIKATKLCHAKKINNYLWLEIDCSTLILSHAPFYKILNCIFFPSTLTLT